jgi:peptidoglycan/LPS O-acetylase OafA/YrhL
MNKAVSLYLDVLRLAAALVVLIVHAHYLLPDGLPVLWRLSAFGGEAVTVFFVLSGFVIAHVVRVREVHASDYLAARFARLYSVVLPALLVTALLEIAGAVLAPADYSTSLAAGAWGIAVSLVFANELWFTQTWPPSNTPFWSLGYEFWYYMIYAAARYVPGRSRKWAVVSLLGLLCGPKILALMPVWLLGVAAYAIHGRVRLLPPAALLLAVVSALGMAWLVSAGAKSAWQAAMIAAFTPYVPALGSSSHVPYTYAFGVLTTIHVIAMMALAPLAARLWQVTERFIRTASAQTFAIYLLHYPVFKFLVAATATAGLGPLRAPAIIAMTLAVIAALGPACDRLKPAMKRWFQVQLASPGRVRVRPDPAVLASVPDDGDEALRGS